MNKIFKVIWSKSKQCYIVVSEIAKNKTGKKKIVVASILAALAMAGNMQSVDATIPEGNATGNDAFAIGPQSNVNGAFGFAIGNNAKFNSGTLGFAIGVNSEATSNQSIAIGYQSKAAGRNIGGGGDPALAVGAGAKATAGGATAIGMVANASNTFATAIGKSAAASGDSSIAIGQNTTATQEKAIAIGDGSQSTNRGSTALGRSSEATGASATALGSLAVANSTSATAVGMQSKATQADTVAIGSSATAAALNSIAMGKNATITAPTSGTTLGGQDSIAVGTRSSANQHSSVSIGLEAKSDGVRSIAIGPKASATDEDTIAIGSGGIGADKNNQAAGANGSSFNTSVAGLAVTNLYYGAKSTGKQSIAIGYTANAKESGIAFGNNAVSDGGGGTAMGKSVLSRNGGVVVGQSSYATGKNSVSYGNTAQASGETSIAVGYSTTAAGQNAVAVGYSISAAGKNSVSIGSTNQAKNEGSIAIGRNNNANQNNTVVIGRDSNALGNQSIAMGANATSKGTNDVAIGNEVTADGDNSVAIGRSATTKSTASLAIGSYGTKGTSATGAFSIAMGRDVTASAESAIAIGKDAISDKKNAVAIGSGADTSTAATAQSSTNIAGKSYSWSKGVLSGADLAGMQVSVGKSGAERQIKNVAAGEVSANSTDAINGSQLYAVASGLAKDLKVPYVSINSTASGTGSNVDNDGAKGSNSIAIGPSSTVTRQNGIAIGSGAQSLSEDSVVIGRDAKAETKTGAGLTTTSRAIVIGSNSRVAADVTQGVAIGSGLSPDEGAVVTGDQSIAIGGNVKVDGHSAIAIGGDDARKAANQLVSYTNKNDAEVTGTLQTAISDLTGYNLNDYKGTTASHAGVAYGASALAGNAGVAIGTAADSMTRKNDKGQVVNNKPVTNAVAIGTGARANFDNSVAIGGGSNTDRYATKQVNAIIDGVEVKWSGGENISPGDVVSFGAKGFERQLKNVAPGEVSQTSTDAINGSQIYSLARKVTNIMNGGAGSLVNVNASGEPLTKVVTGTGTNKQEKYYRTVDVKDDGTLVTGAIAQTPKSLALVNVDEPNVNQQTQTPRTLGNVANGVNDNDAVNVSQLKASTVKYFSVNSTDSGNRDNTGATGANAIAIGPTAKSTGDNGLAIGNNAQANSNYAVALGHYANNGSINSANSISIGWVAGGSSNGASNVAIGTNAGKQITGNNNISLGNTAGTVTNNNVYTSESILLGTEARVKGSTSSKSVNNVIAIGKSAEGSATSATSIGINANASAENAMALGPSSKATAYNGVALGSFSEANTAGGTAGYNVNTSRTDKYAGLTGLALTANTGAVSIGSSTKTRQITNLAAGTNDTDAVNVAQLKSVNLAVKGNSGAGGDVNLATNPLTIKGNDNYITTSASGNTVNISGKVQNISVSNGTAAAAVGMADAKNVAEAINNAVSQNAYTWNLTADNDTAGSRSTITKEGTVKFSGDQNITVKRNGNTITSSLNKSITVDSVKANNSVTTGSGSNQITLDGTTGAVTGKTFSGQSFTAGDNVLSNTTLQIGSPTNGNNVTITKDGLTSKAGTKTAKFGANGIDAGGQQITNVSSGGNVGTNAANITDVKNAVSDVTLNLDTNSKTGTVKLSESPLKVIGANGIRTDLVGTNNGSLVIGLAQATVNATTKGIGLTGDTGSTGNKYLKDGDVSFAVTGDGNLVSTSAITAGVKVAVNAAKVKDLAVEAVTVSKDTQADNPITVTPTAGTNSKDYAIGIDTTKLAGKTDLTYRANNDTDANAQKVSLAKGLNFVNGDNTVATVAADGKVSYDLNAATKTKIDDSATAVARNISLGADSGTASSQSLKDGDVAFNVKGATGDYVSTNMNGNTVEISTKRATINSDANNGTASVTGNDGLATAKNVADAINKAADAAKAGAAWNLTTNSSTTDKTSVQGGDTVDLINGDNIVITQDGTDKKKITVATKKDLTVDSVTAGNTVINTSGLTNGTTAITGSGITTDKVTVGGISIDKTDGINASGKAISNVASGGTTDTNAANIGDVKQAVANLSQNLNITDGTNNGTVDLKNQKLNVAGANGVTATVNNQTITVGLDANTVNATTKGIGLTADTGTTGNKYLKDGDVSFAVTGDGNLVSTSATAAGVKVAVDAAKVKDLAVDAVTVSKDAQADNPITVTPTAGTNSKDYAIGIDTTKLAAKTDLTYRANNDTDANAKKVSLAKGLNFVNGTLTTASIDNDGVVKYDVNTAAITAGTDGTVTGPTTDGVATAQNVADAINAAKKASKTEITANTGEAANATTGNVTLTSTTAADGHTIYDVKLNDKVTLGTGANAVTIDGTAGKATIGSSVVDGVNNTITTGGANAVSLDGAAGKATIGSSVVDGVNNTITTGGANAVSLDGAAGTVTGLTNKDWTPGVTKAVTGRAATEDQLQKVADAASSQTWNITADKAGTTGAQTGTKKNATVGKDETVELVAGDNLTINQDERKFTYSLNKDLAGLTSVSVGTGTTETIKLDGATGKITAKNAAIGGVTVDGDNSHVTGLSNTTWNGTATTGRAATEDQLKAVADTAKATTDAVNLKFSGDTNTSAGVVNLKDDTFNIVGDGKYVTTDANGKDLTVKVSEAEVKKSAVAAVTVSTDTTDANNPISVTPTTSADGTTKDYKVTIDGTKIANKTNLSYKANDGTAKQVSLADGLNFKNGTLTTASIDDAGVVKYDVNTATITAGTDGTVTGPTTDGVATAQNVADAINAAKKAAKTEITANTGEAANATTGNVTLTSTTATDGHTIYDVKLNDTVTLGTGSNAVTIDGTAGKATIGSSVVDGVNNTITTGGANAVALDGVAGTVKTGTVTVTGGTTNDITGLSNTTVTSADFATKGRAATEEQLKAVGEQTWQITADKDATTSGNQTGTKKDAKVGKDDKVQLIAGENLTVNQNERDFTYSLNKDLVKMNSATFEATGGKTTVITGDSIAQTDGTKTNKSTAAGNTVADGGKSTATTADGMTVTNGADSTATTAAGTTVTNANGNTKYAADGVRINTTGKNPVSLTDAGLDNGNNVIKNVASGHVNNDDTDNTNAANIADVKKATTTVTANNGEAANATTGNVTLTSTTATDGHTIYDVKLNDTVTLGTGSNAVTIDGTAGKATIGSSVVDGVNNTITTGGANAVALDGVAGTVKTGTVTVTGGTTNDITGLANTTVNSADFATKGRAATEEQLKAVGEQTWQITADKDATTSGNQTGTKKDAKVGKDDKVQLIAGENLTVNQNERDFTYSLNKDLVKMNSATFEATGGKTTVITGDSIAQTDGTKTNKSTAAGNTVADGGKSTATTADGMTVTNGADSTATTAAGTTVTNANGNTKYAADGVRINTTGKNPVSLTDAGLDNGNNVIKNVASGHVNNDDTDNTNAANIADVKKATTTVTANNGEAANATTGNVTLTSTTATDGHTIYDVKLNDTVTLGTGSNAVTIDGTAGKATIGSSVVDGVNNTITTGGANAVALDGVAGTVKTGTVTVTGGTTNDITGLSNTTVTSADFATKGRAATEEQLKAVGEQTWQITADKDATTSGNQTGTKKDAKVGKDDKVQLIAGENLTVNQNERDFTYSLNKDLVKMNSATFEATGGKTTVITGDSIAQTDGTKTNRSTAAGNTVADGTKSTETTAAGQVIKDGAKTNTSTVDENTLVDGAKSNKTTVDSNVIDDGNGNVNTSNATSNTITDGTNTTKATASTVTVKDNAGNSTVITKDTITTGIGANKVTVDGTAGKVTAGSAVIDGVNNTITTGGANTVKLDGAAGTVTGLTNTAWTPGVTKAVSGRAATEDQLQQVSDAVGAGWNINSGTVAGSTGEANGSAKTKISSGEEVQLQAGNNLIIDQNGKTLAYSLNKNLKDMESAIFNATGGKTTVIKGDSIVQTDGGKTNTSNAAGNTVVDGTKSTATTAAGSTITDGAKTNTNTADKNVIDDGAGNTNTSNATSNTIADPNGNTNTATATSNTLADNAGNSNVSNATSNNLTDNAGNSNVSNATSNTLKNAAGDETKVDAKGATVKDAAGNTTNVASIGATVTNAAGDTTKVEATGTTVADAAGNKATFTKDGVTITKPGKDTVSLTGNGLDNGNNKIVNVADGTNDTDAVNVRQLDAKTKAATTELTANGGESADNTTGNIVLTKTTAPDGHIVYDNKLNDKITLGAADPRKAITVDGTNGTIKAGKDGNAVAINGTDGTIKAGDGTNAVAIDGVNGSVKVADKIALNGKDGKAAIGTVGIDGKDGIITTGGNNPVAVNGKDGVVTGLTNKTWDPNNITSGRAATEDQVQSAVANAGWDATVGTEGSGVNSTPSAAPEKIRPNETLTFKAGNNMMVSHAGKTISYAVNPELTDMKSATFKDAAGNTTVTNGNGITITPGSANPNNPNAGPVSLTKDGLNNGNNQIKGVAPGSDDTDAVNIGQLKASNAKMGDAIGQVAGEVQRVGAHAAAMAALKPIQYDPLEPTQIMAGVGNYRGETAAALGLAHYTNEDTMFNVGVSVGGNHNMVNAGVTHKFGSSPEKKNIPDRYKAGPISSVYVMQDEVSSLKKENAEQKYVIADQAARLNTLEAENERQRQELAETKQGLDDLRAAVDKLLASKG